MSIKKYRIIGLSIICSLALFGCGNKQDTNAVASIDSTSEATSQSILDKIGYKPVYDTDNSTTSDNTENSNTSTEIDVDLTTLSPTMVFAEVYSMLASPDDYVGKVVKLSGTFYSINDEETEKTYFYVLIKDAAACCEQGLEFIWDDGTHTYPDEYPEEKSEVTIIGVFDYYTENGLNFCYLQVDNLS